jgi:hypothetical protein
MKAKIGKASLPMQVSQSFPGTTVPHKWSHSINSMAIICSENEVVSGLIPFFMGCPSLSGLS